MTTNEIPASAPPPAPDARGVDVARLARAEWLSRALAAREAPDARGVALHDEDPALVLLDEFAEAATEHAGICETAESENVRALALRAREEARSYAAAAEVLRALAARAAGAGATDTARAEWAEQSAHTRARQLEVTRARLSARLLTLATLAHNTDEYPDVRTRLAAELEALRADVESGALFHLPKPHPVRPHTPGFGAPAPVVVLPHVTERREYQTAALATPPSPRAGADEDDPHGPVDLTHEQPDRITPADVQRIERAGADAEAPRDAETARILMRIGLLPSDCDRASLSCADLRTLAAAVRAAEGRCDARPLDDWHEDDGPVLWWTWPVVEPPYAGTPLDSGFPSYVTHWTPIAVPTAARAAERGA